ncbi:ribonuclease E activity regulator RraA, partial [Craterilacuibacter sp.]|uniref:ribonuclease E activity regulator RraA n=1 Tax=Craterilacuibacter sp. TaxID=2870909 RepID=UPI003F2E0BE5
MHFLTTDLYDANEGRVQVAEPRLKNFGGRTRFAGQIVTLKLFEDNTLVREVLATNGGGKVLVIDGGGSLRCALLGDQIAELAVKNNWEGVVIYGCIRDSVAIKALDLGVQAIATNPKKSVKRGEGQRDLPVHFA